ncbi:MAG: M56 family metallopeptidase [Paraglaciecola sp.]|uniref:M56 family metallopeptidase n=1 Tax=Paraglaciecola sp. TaxID=1920173 RepID=UPI0032994C12
MVDYFFTNISISLIALCLLVLLKDSPARLQFYIAIAVLFSWFMPWNLVSTIPIMSESFSPLTDEVFNSFIWLENNRSIAVSSPVDSITPSTFNLIDKIESAFYELSTYQTLFILLSTGGLLYFVKDMLNYCAKLKYWRRNSKENNSLWEEHDFKHQSISIRMLDGVSPGMATGPIKPTIWLDKSFLGTSTTQTILTHELNHILQHDPVWMWIITFSQRVLWWNPCVHLFANIAREQLELSCDEKCRQQLQDQYSTDLARILLNGTATTSRYIAAITIKNRTNFNITRLEKLNKENKMKTKHLLTLLVGISMASFVGVAISNQTQPLVQNELSSKNKPNIQTKIGLYRKNEVHNELVDELLQVTKLAKSNDPQIISNILNSLDEWNVTRQHAADKQSERSIKLMSFTMSCYLLDKLGRYDEIPATYDKLFPEQPIEDALFLKHHVATAYIKMGLPQKALDLMADVIQRQPKPKTGSLMLLAHANLAAANYDEVITLSDQIASISTAKFPQISALNYKRAAYKAMGNTPKTDEIERTLKASYSATASAPKLTGFASPVLAHLSDVKEDRI